MKFISNLSIITIDLVKSVIEEVNIHDEDPSHFKDIFNTQSNNSSAYCLYKIDNGEEKLEKEYASFGVDPTRMTENSYLRVNGVGMGTIKAILPNNDLLVVKDLYDDDDENVIGQEKTVYRVKEMSLIHRYFRSDMVM
jgi:hypothetical protein